MKGSFLMKTLFVSLVTWVAGASAWSMTCKLGNVTFARQQFVRISAEFQPEAGDIQVHESPPSECYRLCSSDRTCSAYFIDHRNKSCIIVRKIHWERFESFLIQDEASSYHKKICLPGPGCDHEWAFDIIPSAQLFRYDDKRVEEVVSAEGCMALCVTEQSFSCRSARYETVPKRACILSRHDRRTASETFRSASEKSHVIYLERQCLIEPSSCLFRPRRSRSIVRHQHVEVVNGVHSREDCELACLRLTSFPCRSYQYVTEHISNDDPVCLLSPEDSSTPLLAPSSPISPPTMYSEAFNESFFEKESCIESEVVCEAGALRVDVRVSTPFRGRVYAAGHPYDCYSVSVSDAGIVSLSLPLHGRRCGTRNLGNGTFVNSVVVQHHPFVLRTSDRKIDVACDYEQMHLKLRNAKRVRDGELKPLSHTVTAVAPTPLIRLRVVNATDQDVTGVELGDPLFLKVELADESVYGIFGSDLVARSSGGSETVLLIDDNGCPVEPGVIPGLDRLPGSKSLVAPFQAFKFASDSAVKFQLTVSYCLDMCPPAECEAEATVKSTNQVSYGRRRRKRKRKKRATPGSASHFLDYQPGDVITDVTMESPTFLVNSLKPAWEANQAGNHHLQQLQFLELPEGHVRIRTPIPGFCVSSAMLYLTAGVVGIFQLAILGACAGVLFRGTRQQHYVTTGSWLSSSSRRKLVPSSSSNQS